VSELACWKCGASVPESNLGRQDSCEKCGADTRVCLNCRHYDRAANNECREEQAERQVEKEKGNFCEWFQTRQVGAYAGGPLKSELKSAAESLFKKKS